MELLATRGSIAYGGEPVSLAEHAVQAAHLAELDGAPPALVTATLLHDLGWLLGGGGGHEARGARELTSLFGPVVAEPVRLHVAAKRYRCAVEPAYRRTLSAASTRTLRSQGGPMDRWECAAFAAEPWADDALALRGYDDRAKVPGTPTPELAHFADLARACVRG
jgi:predicted HD phosphohydrolase